jgi:hypothetical protein
MANLVAANAAFQATRQSEETVRSTLDPVTDAPAAEMPRGPDYNELSLYPEGGQGLSNHAVQGHTYPSEEAAPFWAPGASADYESRVNRQVSSAGHAASKELSGEQGPGSMQYTDTLEPQVDDETALGADYFAAVVVGAQPTAGQYMESQAGDPQGTAIAAAFAGVQARVAAQSGMYGDWLNEGAGAS